ncbi:hypothetical protein AQUCO_06200033v1 [Aquilegia coerulea]|uniref:Calponin-homology (CH) domain-containing protein n=1 Tax=Aquilegia coerulea TaxID=218851 RepID=A0A2G5CE96_AQUCA|nr:hypothetical protein AQUCO_06200033v1 [Aquilegia coerulea]
MMPEDVQASREERCFRLWINSLGIMLDKISSGSVNWKQASKPPIKMSFRKVENCNQVVKIGKQLKFSLVNVAGNDIVQENKKLILGNILHIGCHIRNVGRVHISAWNDFVGVILVDFAIFRHQHNTFWVFSTHLSIAWIILLIYKYLNGRYATLIRVSSRATIICVRI